MDRTCPAAKGIRKPSERRSGDPRQVSAEIVIFALFAVGNHWRTGGLELGDRIPNGFRVERFEISSMPVPAAAMASMRERGRGMLPMGSVGITILCRPLVGENGAFNPVRPSVLALHSDGGACRQQTEMLPISPEFLHLRRRSADTPSDQPVRLLGRR